MWILLLLSFFLRSVVTQNYVVEVNNEHVIRGNSAVIKCSIPSFVADFVTVLSWNDNTENEYNIFHHDYTQGIFIKKILMHFINRIN